MDPLETRLLTHFVAVAEELHFTRAAERLGMAQPALSRSIARLERSIGVPLLERTSRTVSLTPAGAEFLADCRGVLQGLGAAVARARRVSLGRLVLAACPGTASGLLGRLVQDGSGLLQPDVLFTHDRPGALRDGRADAALLCRDRDDLTGLHTVEIAEEDPVVLLPRRHDLARHTTLHSTELRDDPHWMDQCPPVGLDELVDRVVLGQLVTVVGSAATLRLPAEVVAVSVIDLPTTVLVMGWLAGSSRPELVELARTAQRLGSEESARHHSAA
ncbi:LysR family transcriptional regulator [Streptomyces sp. NPDC001588]